MGLRISERGGVEQGQRAPTQGLSPAPCSVPWPPACSRVSGGPGARRAQARFPVCGAQRFAGRTGPGRALG